MAPLVRVRQESDERGFKKTARAVGQRDMDKAIAAMQKAMDSERGRRTIRLLGMANSDEE